MKELMEGYLIDLLETLKTGANFLIGELPAFAHEIIVWGIVSNAFAISVSIVVLLIMLGFTKKQYKILTAENPIDIFDVPAGWLLIVGGICVFISAIVTAVNVANGGSQLLKAIFTPRLYLIEQISKMLSGGQ